MGVGLDAASDRGQLWYGTSCLGEKQEKKKEKEHPKLDDVQIKISAMETATNSTSNTDTSSTTSINKKLAEWTRPHNGEEWQY